LRGVKDGDEKEYKPAKRKNARRRRRRVAKSLWGKAEKNSSLTDEKKVQGEKGPHQTRKPSSREKGKDAERKL